MKSAPATFAAMNTTSRAYRTAVRLGVALAPVVGLFDRRLRAALNARREAGDQLLEWARWHRDTSRPLLWFHAASVGEGLQAESVLQRVRLLSPECQIIYTHFSPSAAGLARSIAADAADYLPFDLPRHVDRLLQTLEPDLLVFAKLDLWPELATRAASSGMAVGLIAGTVGPESGRLRWPARALLQPGYRAVTAAAAISSDDASRLARLGVPRERIQVLGDPRFDSVSDRVSAVSSEEPLLRLGNGASTLVAGSTWPADEIILLRAYSRVRRTHPDSRLILVPHEPTSSHLEQVERRATDLGLPHPVRLSAAAGPAPLLLVDRVGVLARLYGAGVMAYVGGGFGRAGLHSVLEPAAWSLPVAFGPHWRNSRDAGLLLEAGGACALPNGRERAVHALQGQWGKWIEQRVERQVQGQRARDVVERGRGASERTASLLLQLISQRPPRRSRPVARSGPLSGQ